MIKGLPKADSPVIAIERSRSIIGLCLVAMLLSLNVNTSFADDHKSTLDKIVEFARTLDNEVYLLVKTRTVRSPVALVFGYFDNEDACIELAADLTAAANSRALNPGPHLYVCDAVY